MLWIPHHLDSQLTDDPKIAILTHRPLSTPQKHYISAAGTHFCYPQNVLISTSKIIMAWLLSPFTCSGPRACLLVCWFLSSVHSVAVLVGTQCTRTFQHNIMNSPHITYPMALGCSEFKCSRYIPQLKWCFLVGDLIGLDVTATCPWMLWASALLY
jgi:hypothetical protein